MHSQAYLKETHKLEDGQMDLENGRKKPGFNTEKRRRNKMHNNDAWKWKDDRESHLPEGE